MLGDVHFGDAHPPFFDVNRAANSLRQHRVDVNGTPVVGVNGSLESKSTRGFGMQ